MSEEKASSKRSSNLKLNRYSIDRLDGQPRKRIDYKTISYDHLNDPEFYGTKGKQDQSASYNVLLQERWKAIEVVRFKVEAFKGFKDSYQSELKRIGSQANSER